MGKKGLIILGICVLAFAGCGKEGFEREEIEREGFEIETEQSLAATGSGEEDSGGLQKIPQNPINPEGTWNRTNVHSGLCGELTISKVTKEGFFVEGEFSYYSHTGSFEQTAYYVTDNVAVAQYDSGFGGDGVECVVFLLEEDRMRVIASASSASLGFGANVSMDGEYTRQEPLYTNAGVLEECFTRQNLDDLAELLPADYYNDYFLFATQEGIVTKSEETIANGYPVNCVEAVVPTMGGYGYTLYFSEDGYYSIKFEDGVDYEVIPAGVSEILGRN